MCKSNCNDYIWTVFTQVCFLIMWSFDSKLVKRKTKFWSELSGRFQNCLVISKWGQTCCRKFIIYICLSWSIEWRNHISSLNKRLRPYMTSYMYIVRISIVLYFEIKYNFYLLGILVSPSMSCKFPVRFVSFLTFVALEWPFHNVRHHVLLQISRFSTSVDALVTLVRFLSCMILHYVEFQFTNSNARILACCTSVWLFTRVRHLVSLQFAWLCCFVITLIAFV